MAALVRAFEAPDFEFKRLALLPASGNFAVEEASKLLLALRTSVAMGVVFGPMDDDGTVTPETPVPVAEAAADAFLAFGRGLGFGRLLDRGLAGPPVLDPAAVLELGATGLPDMAPAREETRFCCC